MTPESKPHSPNGTTATDERPEPPVPGRAAPQTPGATIPPSPPQEAPFPDFGPTSSSKSKPVAFAAAGLLAGAAGGYAVGRATAPRGRFARRRRLPSFGVKRRAVVGGVKLAPTFVRGTYRTGKTAGKGGAKLIRAVRRTGR